MKTAKIIHDNNGKLDEKSTGLGEISANLIQERAQELAIMDGRKPHEFTQADYATAKAELSGAYVHDMDHTPEPVNGVRLPEEAVASTGFRYPKGNYEDEETIGSHLVLEGVEEAQHDEMLEAGKQTLRDEDIE